MKTQPLSVLSQSAPLFRSALANRRLLVSATVVLLTAGALFKQDQLVALSVAPFLFALLPCAAMCALGLCMAGGKDKAKQPNLDAAAGRGLGGNLSETAVSGSLVPAPAAPRQATPSACCTHEDERT